MNESRFIHILASDESEGEAFFAANPALVDQVEMQIGFTSPGELINRWLESWPGDYICLGHSDIYLVDS